MSEHLTKITDIGNRCVQCHGTPGVHMHVFVNVLPYKPPQSVNIPSRLKLDDIIPVLMHKEFDVKSSNSTKICPRASEV